MATNEDEIDDPFSCFDSSDDDNNDDDDDNNNDSNGNNGNSDNTSEEKQPARDPGNGVLAFHAGTEVSLLHWVRTELAKKHPAEESCSCSCSCSDSNSASAAILHRAATVLELVDTYCLSRHWMMHVGPEKAGPLRDFLSSCLSTRLPLRDTPITPPSATATTTTTATTRLTVLELGTYCGYSSIFFAKTLLELLDDDNSNDDNNNNNNNDNSNKSFHIYSVEVVEGYARVARELIRLAGMEDFVTVILVDDPDDAYAAAGSRGAKHKDTESSSLSFVLEHRLPSHSEAGAATTTTTTIPGERPQLDFVFVDHDKSLYLPHLQELERTGWVRAGTHVAADNVVFAQIDDYREYMAQQASDGIVETRLEDSLLIEYCQPELAPPMPANNDKKESTNEDMLRDGIEFSVYLKDPRPSE